jgi:acyl carrier protein
MSAGIMNFLKNLWTVVRGHNDAKAIQKVRENLGSRPQLDAKSFAEEYFTEDKREVAKRLMEITREYSVADITGLRPEDAFVTDLRMDDLDSMAIVDFVIHVERDFGVTIPEHKAKSMKTFGELVDEIVRLTKT